MLDNVHPDITHRKPWFGADEVQIAHQVQHLHNLGARQLLEFLEELAADEVVSFDVKVLLVRYAQLDAGMVAALDGRDLALAAGRGAA